MTDDTSSSLRFPPRDVRGADLHQWLYDHPNGYRGNAQERKAFQQWCGDRFDAWYARAHAWAVTEGEQETELLEADFYADGVMAYERAKNRERLVKQIAEGLPNVTDEQRKWLENLARFLGPQA
ncbi:MAG: hypothetical protein J2P28_20815 [Actinobacteria bacterium]|nr:hypothetical protein [Actinomycetota bacterium]